jgi:hypothetical protein
MATAGSAIGFRFVQQSDFDDLVATRTLAPGTFYYTPTLIYLARSKDEYYVYGGASVQDITTELLQRETFTTELIEALAANVTFRQVIVQSLIGDSNFQTFVSNLLLSDTEFRDSILEAIANMSIRETVIDVVSEIVSVVAPDGSTVATNNGGRLTLQVATNSQFGIVKGQANDSPTTWHNVSIANGVPSVNRGQVESVMDSKDTLAKNDVRNSINVRAEDNCIVGTNNNGIITLPIRQAETEPVTPPPGLTLIKE